MTEPTPPAALAGGLRGWPAARGLANAAGIALYLAASSTLWPRPGEEACPGGPGDAFAWLFLVVPILLLFSLLALAALVSAVRSRGPRRRAVLALWVVVVTLWGAAVRFGEARAVRVVDREACGVGARASPGTDEGAVTLVHQAGL